MTIPLGEILASLNACLNGLAALCLLLGFRAIRNKRVEEHRRWMLLALGVSTLFLVSYVTRFTLTGVHRFPGEGPLRQVYLVILFSHTTLAILVPPLAGRTLYLAWRKEFPRHRRWARWTFPIWLYVSVTGVVVYGMLYGF